MSRALITRPSGGDELGILDSVILWLQNALFSREHDARMCLSVKSDSRPRLADPGATRPAAWRAVARTHLPSWDIFHGTPQPGGWLPAVTAVL